MVVDYTITIGNLIEIGSIVGGGLLVLVTLRNTVTGLKEDVTSIQYELRKMGDVLTKMAVAEILPAGGLALGRVRMARPSEPSWSGDITSGRSSDVPVPGSGPCAAATMVTAFAPDLAPSPTR